MRLILDTNIIISGVLSPHGAARALLDMARSGTYTLVTSAVLLDELEEVLERFMIRAIAGEIRMALEEVADVVDAPRMEPVSRDPDDDYVLATAAAGRAEYIVTRDRDLLVLGQHEGIEILDPAPMLNKLRGSEDNRG